MDIDFEEEKKIYDVVSMASDKYDVKIFKRWQSSSGKEFITIQLEKVDEK